MPQGYARQAAINNETIAIFTAAVIWILTAIIGMLTTAQTIFVFQDFCTVDRKSVGYGKSKPVITPDYKFINYASLVSLYVNFLPLLGSLAIQFSSTDSECDVRWTFTLCSQQLAKVTTYCILLARLHRLYKHSVVYAFPLNCLYFFGVVVVIYSIGAIIAIIRFPNTSVVVQAESYPSWCVPTENLFFLAGGIIFMQDICVAIGFLWSFGIPLDKLLAYLEKKGDTKRHLVSNIVYYGSKIRVLTGTMLVGTIGFTFLAAVTGLGVFGAIDVVIVPICLTLMTPYYPDDKYYQKLCCLCYNVVQRGKEFTDLSAFKELLISGLGPDVELNYKGAVDLQPVVDEPATNTVVS